MLVVGIAGPAGSGKSSVCRLLSRRPGFVHLDCDRLAWESYAPGGPAYEQVLEAFGPGILSPTGVVDRKKLGEVAFADPGKRQKLEAIVHPEVVQKIRRAIVRERKRGTRALLVEGALLYHSPHVPRDLFDLALWLEAPEEVRRGRLRAAGLPEEVVERRLAAQRELRPPPWVTVVDATPPPEEVARRVLSLIQGAMGGSD